MSRKAKKVKRDRRAEALAFDIAVGARIRSMREAKDLKQSELGIKIGLSEGGQVSRYENGKATCEPYTLALIAAVLGCKAGDFVNDIEVRA